MPASRRTRATTSWEVIPPGLSTTTSPDVEGHRTSSSASSVLVGLARLLVGVGLAGVGLHAAGGRLLVERLGPGQHLLDVAGVLRHRVGDERQRGRVAHAELLGDLGAEQALGRLQRGRRAHEVGLLAQDGVEHRGLLRVTGDPDVGDGHEPEARVLDPPLQHLRDDDLDPVGDLPYTGVGHDSVPGEGSLSWLSRPVEWPSRSRPRREGQLNASQARGISFISKASTMSPSLMSW